MSYDDDLSRVDVRPHPLGLVHTHLVWFTPTWLGQIDLLQLIRLQLQVPHVPKIKGELDTSNFPHYDDEPDEPYEDDGTGWDDPF
jgi:hypothetical protein